MPKPRLMAHEDLSRREDVKGSSDRLFGLVFAAVFLILALWPLLSGAEPRRWCFAASSIFLLLALVRPRLLGPLNRLWTWLGFAMHVVASAIVLRVLFYAVLTPMGLLRRWLGQDSLRLKKDPDARTYWIERAPPGPAPETMRNQF